MMRVSILVVFLLSCFIANAQPAWELKKNEDGIKVYTRSSGNSRLKSIKVTCDLDGSLSELTALLLDANAHTSWVYSTKSSHVVKQISPNEQLYYSEINLPWPLTNRDVVVLMSLRQDPETKVLEVKADAVSSDIPAKKGIVRVLQSSVVWQVKVLSPEKISVEYIAQADPGGNVPAWITNMFSTKGPLETFRRLKKLMASERYAPAKYAFIVD